MQAWRPEPMRNVACCRLSPRPCVAIGFLHLQTSTETCVAGWQRCSGSRAGRPWCASPLLRRRLQQLLMTPHGPQVGSRRLGRGGGWAGRHGSMRLAGPGRVRAAQHDAAGGSALLAVLCGAPPAAFLPPTATLSFRAHRLPPEWEPDEMSSEELSETEPASGEEEDAEDEAAAAAEDEAAAAEAVAAAQAEAVARQRQLEEEPELLSAPSGVLGGSAAAQPPAAAAAAAAAGSPRSPPSLQGPQHAAAGTAASSPRQPSLTPRHSRGWELL